MDIFELIENDSIAKIIDNIGRFDLEKLDEDGDSPLHLAVIRNDKELLEALLSAAENIDVKNKNGDTALHIAVKNSNYDLVETILLYGGRADIRDRKNRTASYLAGQNNQNAIYELIKGYE